MDQKVEFFNHRIEESLAKFESVQRGFHKCQTKTTSLEDICRKLEDQVAAVKRDNVGEKYQAVTYELGYYYFFLVLF